MIAHFQDTLFLQNVLILQCTLFRKPPSERNTHTYVFICKQIYAYLFIKKNAPSLTLKLIPTVAHLCSMKHHYECLINDFQ